MFTSPQPSPQGSIKLTHLRGFLVSPHPSPLLKEREPGLSFSPHPSPLLKEREPGLSCFYFFTFFYFKL